MNPMNSPDTTEGLGHQADGLYPPLSPSVDTPASTPAAMLQGEVSSPWADALRCTVRDHPLAAVGAAAALGMLLVRMAR